MYTRPVTLHLPFGPPIEPMLAKVSDGLPNDDGWLFEPKWDGFRAIVFRDGDEVYTQSRDLKPLDRYFPELAGPLKAALPERCVLDGEVVIAHDGSLDFGALLLRIHPAASRVKMLAEASPASFVAWDLLALDDEDLRALPQGTQLRLGREAIIALGRLREPCEQLTPLDARMPASVEERVGWMARVVKSGRIKVSDPVTVLVEEGERL